MSIEWRAFASLESPRAIRMTLRARGAATSPSTAESPDGNGRAEPGVGETLTTLAFGRHELVVRVSQTRRR